MHSADLVKTPEAKPNVESLALAITSSSVSKGSTDMTGPKISSFTQVMSSLQLSVPEGRGGVNMELTCWDTWKLSDYVKVYRRLPSTQGDMK